MGGDVNDGFDLLPARLETKVGTSAAADIDPLTGRRSEKIGGQATRPISTG